MLTNKILYNVTGTRPLLTTSYTCYATEDAGQIVNSFYYNLHPHVTTITHNYLLRCVTFTQFTILHVPNPYSICHTVFLTHLTFSHFPCLSPIGNSLVEQLLNN
jgi:hypothetical protein